MLKNSSVLRASSSQTLGTIKEINKKVWNIPEQKNTSIKTLGTNIKDELKNILWIGDYIFNQMCFKK